MQKNYRDFTVGELIDLGYKVELRQHGLLMNEAMGIASKFEGTKQSLHTTPHSHTVRAWKGNFEVCIFLKTDNLN
ncbi:hypothetical protein ACI3ER_12075 [Bacillus sp. Wb]